MQRRKFLKTGISAIAGVSVSANFSFAQALKESSRNLSGNKTEYDLVIKSGTLSGVFAALSAAKRGLRVLLLESRPYLGTDIVANRRLWLKADGYEKLKPSSGDIFFPQDEKKSYSRVLKNDRAEGDEECLLMAGSVKKGLLRSAIKGGVDVMLMADVCGVLRDADNAVCGVFVALKQGLFAVKCSAFLDASENSAFTRILTGENLSIGKCRYVIELENANVAGSKPVDLDGGLKELVSSLTLHCNKRGDDRAFAEFEFSPASQSPNRIEQQARALACQVSKLLAQIEETESARTNWIADSVSMSIGGFPNPPAFENYFVLENPFKEYACSDVCRIAAAAEKMVSGIKRRKQALKSAAVLLSGREQVFEENFERSVDECGWKLPLVPVNPSKLTLPNCKSEILVAGCGTAGAEAAKSALGKFADVAVLEYFNNPGGTKVLGGVIGYYWGITEHEHIKKIGKELAEFSREHRMSPIVAKSLSAELSILSRGGRIFTNAIVCAAGVDKSNAFSKRRLAEVFASVGGTLTRFTPKITVDATADADVAYFAGEEFSLGDARMGITQNYSQWSLVLNQKNSPRKFNDMTHKDLDLLDTTSISEFQRGLILSHYESSFYDLYPLLSVRESRLPRAAHVLTLPEALNSFPFVDTIAQSYSDFDPHHFSPSEISRCALVLPHYTNKRRVNIPYSSLVPKNIDGLIFSGRGIGASHLAFQFTRMSADVEVLGYVCGEIAAECARSKIEPRDFKVAALQKSLEEKNYLPKDVSQCSPANPLEIVEKLASNDSSALLEACICNAAGMKESISGAFEKKPSLALAKALCWHGFESGAQLVAEDLRKNFARLKENPQPKDYTETYSREKLESAYWRVCADIAYLAMPQKNLAQGDILDVLKFADTGGEMTRQEKAYFANRIDLCLVPNFNLLINLAFYAERNPSPLFAGEFERILQDPNLRGCRSLAPEDVRWNAYLANLALAIAAAGARCGSERSAELLVDYLDDVHIFFRRFANSELCSIFKVDANFDKVKWGDFLSKNKIPEKAPYASEVEV